MEPEVLPTEATGFYDLIPSTGGVIKKVPNYGDLLRAFKRETNYFRDVQSEKTYSWCGTHYRIVTTTEIKSFAEKMFCPSPPEKTRNEFLHKVLVNNLKEPLTIENLFFESIKGKLNLKNGVLNIKTLELTQHDRELGFRYVLPYDYDPNATCPNFMQFLREVTLDRPSLMQTLLEFMGYCLWPGYDDHCFLWLSGGGRNGKSTYMDIIKAMVGDDNCTSILLDQFAKPNYVEMMNRKLVNLSEESDSKKIPNEILSTLKTLSAGGNVMVDQKYGIPYSMRNTAKLGFASNTPPNLGEAQDAIKSRMIVVPFDLRLEDSFTGISQVRGELAKELAQELPGILNVVLRSLQEFLARSQRKIHRGLESKEALTQIVQDSDPIERWVTECFILDPEKNIAMSVLTQEFKKFVTDDSETPSWKLDYINNQWLGKKLRSKFGNKIKLERAQVLGKRDTIVYGISTKLSTEF